MKEKLKKSGKFIAIGVVLIVLYYIFKPTSLPTAPTVSKSTGDVSTPDFGGNDKNYIPDAIALGHPYLTDDEIAKIVEERKKVGAWNNGENINWDDYSKNADEKIGPTEDDRWKTTAIFKGINVKPTGGGVWPNRLGNIIVKIRKNEGDKIKHHWEMTTAELLIY